MTALPRREQGLELLCILATGWLMLVCLICRGFQKENWWKYSILDYKDDTLVL